MEEDPPETPITDPELAFDLAALKAALRRRTLEWDCPVCGEGRSAIPDGTVVIQGGVRPDGTIDGSLGMQAIAVVCMNCGYVRLHAARQLLD